MIRGISINCDESGIDGRLDILDEDLARVQRAGFDGYELSIEAMRCLYAAGA